MVSRDSSSNSASIMHQFILSDSISSQTQFENHHFDSYGSSLRANGNTFPQSPDVLSSIHSLGERMSRSVDLVQAQTEESEMNHTRHLMDLLGAANETNRQAQRLSLSLGSHMLVPSVPYSFGNRGGSEEFLYPGNQFAASSPSSFNRCCTTSYGSESFANSRFFKPAQSLLEETVSVGGNAVDLTYERNAGRLTRNGKRLSSELKAELCINNGFLSPENHEFQMKIAKLIGLLEEVDDRYEKYYHQMEDVVSSFEEIAGLGSAKSYTALALQAMSRHFCSLRAAIMSQINATKKKMTQVSPKINNGLSQLSLFEREARHNRVSLQQLGMFQSHRQAWRPIRGLPETSVAILRTWLFEHFLHPYPNDSEKLMLASQTGLSKNQVANWFINARVRLWKPMIEEMYKEEFAESPAAESDQLLASSSSVTGDGVSGNAEE